MADFKKKKLKRFGFYLPHIDSKSDASFLREGGEQEAESEQRSKAGRKSSVQPSSSALATRERLDGLNIGEIQVSN